MKKVIRINIETGKYIEDVILQDGEPTPPDCIETPCPDGFYLPKWDGISWIEGLTQAEIDAQKNTTLVDAKAIAIEKINAATTIAGLKAAMLEYINAE